MRIDHIYRPDDGGGTGQDTGAIFREHLQFDRWCNGKSEGNVNAAGSNLKNSDLDPIRRPCKSFAGDSSQLPTRCTYYPLDYPPVGSTCHNGESLAANDPHNPYGVAIPCTQGLIIALSEADRSSNNISQSIGQRIASDANGLTIGLGGPSVLNVNGGMVSGISINTVTSEDFNIRTGEYMLSRRLFLQRRPDAFASGYISAARNLEEMKLFNWATNRCNIHDIVVNAGFIPPLQKCWFPCPDPFNITCLTAGPGVDAMKQNIGAETTACDANYPCVANGAIGNGSCGGVGTNCPPIPAESQGYVCPYPLNVKCSTAGNVCRADSTGLLGTCAP